MRFDTNTSGHMQWFYFSIKNTKAIKIKLNIFRFKKRYSLFQRGFRPFVKSRKSGKDWLPGGDDVKYLRECLPNQNGVKTGTHRYYLTFTYAFQHQNDQVFFAACIPYTTTYLNKRLVQLKEAFTQNQKIKFEVKNLCTTLCGQQIEYLSVEPYRQSTQNKRKKIIIINARSHPGETSSSWVLEGFLQSLSQNSQIHEWICNTNICFKIIPMLNKDGVFMGNYRTGIVGDDFNRKFVTGTKVFFPQIYGMKKLVAKCKRSGNIKLFLDLHGHSILKNSFIFGPDRQSFQNSKLINLGNFLFENSKYFSQTSSHYRNQKQKIETARVFFQLEQEILSLTCQNSLGLYTDNYQTFQQTAHDWKSFGNDILLSIKDCFQQPERFIDDNLKKKSSYDFSANTVSKQILKVQNKKKVSEIVKRKVSLKQQIQKKNKKQVHVSSQSNKSTQIRRKEIKGIKPADLDKNKQKQSTQKEQEKGQLQKSIILSRYKQSQIQSISRSFKSNSKNISKQSYDVNQLEIEQQIPQNFSEEYESMNDSDSQTDDISLSKRQQLFKCIQQLNCGLINQNSLDQINQKDHLQVAKGFKQYKLNFQPQNISIYDKKPGTKLKPLKFQEHRLRGATEKKIKGNIDIFFTNQSLFSSDRDRVRLNRRKNQILNRKYNETKREELINEMFPKKEEKEYLLMRIKEMTLQKGKQSEK